MKHSLPRIFAAPAFVAMAQTPCEQLKSLRLPDGTVTLAESVAPGPLQIPGTSPNANVPILPAHCRVAATWKPSSDSDIKIEVWLPERAAWNGKFEAVGGGGWVGS